MICNVMGTRQRARRIYRQYWVYPLRRLRTLLAWRRLSFAGVPVVMGNAMPKSGSKLLVQILNGFKSLAPLVESSLSPIRTNTANGRTRSPGEVESDLRHLRPGDFSLGYLHATPANQALLSQPGWASFFLYRDPRDLLVSHVFYATDINPNHGMHDYYQGLSMEQRLQTAITGIHQDGLNLPSVRTRYERILSWLDTPRVLPVRYEDLILERESTLEAMLQHFENAGYALSLEREKAIRLLSEAIDPQRSPTFRKGKVGNWREHFSVENKKLFKEVAGELLIRLGYEQDNDW